MHDEEDVFVYLILIYFGQTITILGVNSPQTHTYICAPGLKRKSDQKTLLTEK